ncbi:MAG: peptide deformylase [Bacteroidales bacterium]|nr:peptide deformylase [Bacteroidales bacterium]
MVYPIFVNGSAVLRKVAKDIDSTYENLQEFVDNMFETMYKSEGVGLAAPQVGKSIRLFVVDTTPFEEDDPTLKGFKKVFINPVITERSGNTWVFNEGCLSVPEIREDVERPDIIKIKYLDENFKPHEETYDGIKARVIQHEYDHIEGILFVDRLSAIRKKLLKGRLNAITKGKFKTNYKTRIL